MTLVHPQPFIASVYGGSSRSSGGKESQVGPLVINSIFTWTVETVRDFIFLGSKITEDGECSHDIKRCFLLGSKVMTNLDSILKSREINLLTKASIVKAMIFPVVMYGCESWTIKKAECRRIDAFEPWCWSGKDWRREKGTTEDEIVGWHHQLNGHEFEQIPGDSEGQGSLVCCSPWGWKDLDMT